MARHHSLSGVARAAIAGVLLLAGGVGIAALDAQARSDAADASIAESRARIESTGEESFSFDMSSMRQWFVFDNLRSGGPMPTVTIVEDDEGGVSYLSWGPADGGMRPGSLGGWQLKPAALLPAAGLTVMIGSGFVAAVRWRPRHPLFDAATVEESASN